MNSENAELSVAIDASDTQTVINLLNKSLKEIADNTKTMADKMGQASEKMTKDIDNLGKKVNVFDQIKKSILGLVSLQVVRSVFRDANNEAQQAAKTNLILSNTLKNIGMQYSDIAKDVARLADLNAVDDDDIKQAYNLGIALQVPNQRLSEFVETAYNFKAVRGLPDIRSAMRFIADDARKGGTAWDTLKKSVEGASASGVQASERLSAASQEMSEQFGFFLRSILTPIYTLLYKVIKAFNDWESPIKTIIFSIATFTGVMVGLKAVMGFLPPAFATVRIAALNLQSALGIVGLIIMGLTTVITLLDEAEKKRVQKLGYSIDTKTGQATYFTKEGEANLKTLKQYRQAYLDELEKTKESLKKSGATEEQIKTEAPDIAMVNFRRKNKDLNKEMFDDIEKIDMGKPFIKAIPDVQTYKNTVSKAKDEMSKFEHEINMGLHTDRGEQIIYYQNLLDNMKKQKADLKDVWEVEEKIFKLKKEQKDITDKLIELQNKLNELQKTTLKGESLKELESRFKGISKGIIDMNNSLKEQVIIQDKINKLENKKETDPVKIEENLNQRVELQGQQNEQIRKQAASYQDIMQTTADIYLNVWNTVEATGDWGQAAKDVVSTLLQEIPIVGGLLSKLWGVLTNQNEINTQVERHISMQEALNGQTERYENTIKNIETIEKSLTNLATLSGKTEEEKLNITKRMNQEKAEQYKLELKQLATQTKNQFLAYEKELERYKKQGMGADNPIILNLESRITYLKQMSDFVTKSGGIITDEDMLKRLKLLSEWRGDENISSLAKSILEENSKAIEAQLDLEDTTLDILKSQTEEREKQLGLLKDMGFDMENQLNIMKIQRSLEKSGLSDIDIRQKMLDLGVSTSNLTRSATVNGLTIINQGGSNSLSGNIAGIISGLLGE